MFGLFRRNKPVVLDHWYVLLPDFQTSSSEFYKALGTELEKRQVPGLEVTQVSFPEGSILSARREYLRMRRERLLFEVCSTSFGTSWFFSCRFSELPLRFRLRYLLILLFAFSVAWMGYQLAFGALWGPAVLAASILGLIFLLKGVIPLGMLDLDQRLLRLPVIGPVYEIFLRPNTYFREDTRLMYCDLVNQVVRGKIQEFAGNQNVTQVEFKRDESMPAVTKGVFANMRQLLWAGLKKT